ncbi:adenylyl-sulfate kinase [Janthinobacterium sp. RB2R34]|uniref:adenylyl-sulfate kinase n=1 Tax=Janthinobacterium sp. RB2R34 TaxID=3424193 RepID=UPI003F24E1AF
MYETITLAGGEHAVLALNGRAYAEVYVATVQAICVARSPKGLYQRALDGKLNGMTGLQAPYEPPLAPEIRIDTSTLDVEECIALLLAYEPCVSSGSNRTETR